MPTLLFRRAALLGLAVVSTVALAAVIAARPHGATAAEASARGHDFTFEAIDGGPLALHDFVGRPLLVVNTASRCGFTGQYEGLQALWERYRDQGLVVIGVPSNDFRQELADAEAVKEFCETVFSIDFPMADITQVTGRGAHPFYKWAAAQSRQPQWNFNKYLIAADGAFVGHYSQAVTPAELAGAIDALLSDGAPS